MSNIDLEAAHQHCRRHRAELSASTTCGCFYCRATFAPAMITEWVNKHRPDNEWSALCPECGINAVIGDASGLPLDQDFLEAMHNRWFERVVTHSEAKHSFRSKT